MKQATSPITRMAYEAREAELMDQRTRVKSALEKGKAEGKAEGRGVDAG